MIDVIDYQTYAVTLMLYGKGTAMRKRCAVSFTIHRVNLFHLSMQPTNLFLQDSAKPSAGSSILNIYQ